jgi:DNA-binding MarR family transcriptional regulator
MADLARALMLDRTALTRALQPMVREGLIELSESPHDQRARLVLLTRAGRKRLTEASALWAAAQDKYVQAVGERQAVALRALSQIVADAELGT